MAIRLQTLWSNDTTKASEADSRTMPKSLVRRLRVMKTAATIIQVLIRLLGLIMIVLGLLFWTGNALTLIPVHILRGMTLVLLSWTQAVLPARAGAGAGLVALGLVWGLVVVALGMMQNRLLPGEFHWVIKVLPLLVGIAAIGLADRLAVRAKLDRLAAEPTDMTPGVTSAR